MDTTLNLPYYVKLNAVDLRTWIFLTQFTRGHVFNTTVFYQSRLIEFGRTFVDVLKYQENPVIDQITWR